MPEVTPFQVLIVDDHPLMRRGIRQLLELDPAFHVVAEAGDGASAIDLANRIEPDLILLDLNMKGLSGLDTLNALRRDGVTAQIIILTVSGFRQRHLRADRRRRRRLSAQKIAIRKCCWRPFAKALTAVKVFSDRVNEYLRERERFWRAGRSL